MHVSQNSQNPLWNLSIEPIGLLSSSSDFVKELVFAFNL
jgi:hypothetical protein